MVVQILNEMEKAGLVILEVISTKHIVVSYKTSELGDSVLAVLKKSYTWSTTNKV